MKSINSSSILISLIVLFINSCSKNTVALEPLTSIQYTLTVTASEGGSVVPTTTKTYNDGAVVTITATPDQGYEFVRWLGSGNDDKPNPCGKGRELTRVFRDCHITITINSNMNVQAFFQRISD